MAFSPRKVRKARIMSGYLLLWLIGHLVELALACSFPGHICSNASIYGSLCTFG